MKKWVFSFTAILLGGHVFYSGQPQRHSEILAKLHKEYATLETVSCRFNQTKVIRQLEGEIRLEGRLYFKKPFFLRLELTGEENLRVYMDGRTIWLEDLDLEEVEVYAFDERETSRRLRTLLPPVFLRDTDELEKAFVISVMKEDGGKSRLQLVPRGKKGMLIRSIEFDVDRWSRISWMKAEYENGDWTETEFRSWQRHREISDHFFRYRNRVP